MASTQKLIITIFLINLFIGMAHSAYETTTYDSTFLDNKVGQYDEFTDQFENEDQNEPSKDTNDFSDNSYGSTISWGRIIFKTFVDGINPFSTSQTSTYETDLEKNIMDALSVFRVLMYIIIIVELYMLIKNKKNS